MNNGKQSSERHSLGLCKTAGSQGGLSVRASLQACKLQHIHLYVCHMTRQRLENSQNLLHQVVTMVTNSS